MSERIKELLRGMLDLGASDLFVVAGKPPRIRRNTVMEELDVAAIDTAEVESFRKGVLLPESERVFLETGGFDSGITFDDGTRYRINFLSQQGVPGLVARLVPSGELSFEELAIPKVVADLAEKPRGLVLVVGPAGSGKSTTMAAMLNHINVNVPRHIVTIEDPIEFVHRDARSLVTQREVGSDVSSFSEALRHVVRESPDAIFIGEMRDLDTMRAAISAALTGHLVVSTLHTADVVQTVERVVNHFPDHLREQAAADLALALEGIVAQRLVPKADGSGVVPACEVLVSTPVARHSIARRDFSELEEVMKRGAEEGMVTFPRALANLCESGVITVRDGARRAGNADEFLLLVKGMESGIETFREDPAEMGGGQRRMDMRVLLHSAIANDASDLLLTVGAPPVLRIDGDLQPLETDDLTPADTKRLLFSVLNSNQRGEFEESREIDFALSVNLNRSAEGRSEEAIQYRFRVNGFFQRGNVAVALRVIPREIPPPGRLGLPKSLLAMAGKRQGLILVTGPTGHGKSTTLASLINRINETRPCHIITVEDPIEYVHANKKAVVEQREVYADTLGFSNALKFVLRQDPDVILVGEMRDPETIAAALTAAETGHLVMATLHTNDAAQSIDRIIDSFPAHQQNQIRIQLAGSLLGIVSQRLIPRKNGSGRIAAFEVMVNTSAVRTIIREAKTHLAPSVIETGAKDGMVTMEKAVSRLYEKNLISRAEAIRHKRM